MVGEGGRDKTERSNQRFKVLKSAKIVLDDWSAIDCSVKDLSETGAKIVPENPAKVPDHFRFLLLSDKTIRPATVVWRDNDVLGIEFNGPPTKAALRKF